MYKVRSEGFDLAINEHATKGKRIIGICLGFQVMTHFSEEDGYSMSWFNKYGNNSASS